MKVAQLSATIPDLLPEEYARKLAELQSNAPPMSWVFVKRRMKAELGENWEKNFTDFDKDASFAASLGQVHKAKLNGNEIVACKLQYPDMSSAVIADLNQLKIIFKIYSSYNKSIQIRERKASSGATVEGLKKENDLIDRINSELNLSEENILENSNLFGIEELPDAINQEDLLDKKKQKRKTWIC